MPKRLEFHAGELALLLDALSISAICSKDYLMMCEGMKHPDYEIIKQHREKVKAIDSLIQKLKSDGIDD